MNGLRLLHRLRGQVQKLRKYGRRGRHDPPAVAKTEPYKTHLAYVKERRSDDEAAQLLDEALTQLRERRGQA